MKLKFCGIRREEDVRFCNALLPEYMGMILSQGFRRSAAPETAARLVQKKRPEIAAVGVFVNESTETILELLRQIPLDVIQLHGDENAAQIAQLRAKTGLLIWKAVRVKSASDIASAQQLGADCLVLEGYCSGQVGGTGKTADWSLIAQSAPKTPFFLAGGLRPDNLQDALQLVHPEGVDFSSGIETDGVKDFEKMKEIVKIVRGE